MVKTRDKYEEIRRLTDEQRKDILEFSRKRSKEITDAALASDEFWWEDEDQQGPLAKMLREKGE